MNNPQKIYLKKHLNNFCGIFFIKKMYKMKSKITFGAEPNNNSKIVLYQKEILVNLLKKLIRLISASLIFILEIKWLIKLKNSNS